MSSPISVSKMIGMRCCAPHAAAKRMNANNRFRFISPPAAGGWPRRRETMKLHGHGAIPPALEGALDRTRPGTPIVRRALYLLPRPGTRCGGPREERLEAE